MGSRQTRSAADACRWIWWQGSICGGQHVGFFYYFLFSTFFPLNNLYWLAFGWGRKAQLLLTAVPVLTNSSLVYDMDEEGFEMGRAGEVCVLGV